jgi:C1A family cysteine protease
MTDVKKRTFGWRRDHLDARDKLFVKYRFSDGNLPSRVDLRDTGFVSPVLDQDTLGSCTSFGILSLCEYLQNKDKGNFTPMSELFLYYQERVLENSVRRDDGAEIRDGIKAMKKFGCCHSETWPYDISKFKNKPPKLAYREALNHQITSYYRLNSLIDMKQCLADGFPFTGGIAVYSSFENESVSENGIVPYPSNRETYYGGHCISFFGFDDFLSFNGEIGFFICKNSWGNAWGSEWQGHGKGWFYLPYRYASNPRLCSDLWTIRSQEQG